MVKKAVILAGGLGTRMLPASKSLAKEMFPIIDKPILQILMEDLKDAGIKEILIVTSRGKEIIEQHFDRDPELEQSLIKGNKSELLEQYNQILEIPEIYYIRQKNRAGVADALSYAESFVGNNPFVLLFGDGIVFNENNNIVKQLVDDYNINTNPVLITNPVNYSDVNKYGIIEPGENNYILKITEKPKPEEAKSNLAVTGHYLLNKKIFEIIKNTSVGANGEVCFVSCLNKLENLRYKVLEGKYFDTGNKIGYLTCIIEYALKNPTLAPEIKAYLKELVKGF